MVSRRLYIHAMYVYIYICTRLVLWPSTESNHHSSTPTFGVPPPQKKQASPDAHADYNALMNCIFSAHRSAVPVDACVLGFGDHHGGGAGAAPAPRDSSFLQQAAYITGKGSV